MATHREFFPDFLSVFVPVQVTMILFGLGEARYEDHEDFELKNNAPTTFKFKISMKKDCAEPNQLGD